MVRSIFGYVNSFVMALLFAIIVWAVATNDQFPSREGIYPDSLPIEIINRPEGLIVFEKKTETVRVKLRAPQVSWDELRATSFRVTADIQGLGVGSHQVPISVHATDSRVTLISVEPAMVGIRLEEWESREFEIHSEVLDAPPVGYIYRAPIPATRRVTVSGPAILVNQVAEVSADITLRSAKTSVEREVTLVPRGEQGNTVPGVTLTPATTMVKVQVEQRVGYKDVSIKAVLKGAVAPGYWVSNIVVAPSTVTLAGNPDALAKIQGFVETVPIDVNAATTEVNRRAVVSLPEGVSILNNEGVVVQVSVTPILGGQTVRRKVTLPGLRRGLSAIVSPDSVEVILSGPLPLLQSLAPDDVQVVVDVANLAVGVHQLKPRVPVLSDGLRVQNIVPDTIQVVISEATATPTIAPTQTVTQTQTLTPTPTPTR